MSWSFENRDGQMYIYCKGSVQLQWDNVEKILIAKLKGSQSRKKFQLLQMMRQRQQHSYKSS